ncbi:Uncharacterised protein [Vibrio cholerae]|nr:Uncharacterised protein [Vibrio cholerae]
MHAVFGKIVAFHVSLYSAGHQKFDKCFSVLIVVILPNLGNIRRHQGKTFIVNKLYVVEFTTKDQGIAVNGRAHRKLTIGDIVTHAKTSGRCRRQIGTDAQQDLPSFLPAIFGQYAFHHHLRGARACWCTHGDMPKIDRFRQIAKLLRLRQLMRFEIVLIPH